MAAAIGLWSASTRGQSWLATFLEQGGELQQVAPEDVPQYGTFWSLQQTNWPPLPFNPFPDLPVYYLSGNSYLLDDQAVDYEALDRQRRIDRARAYLEADSGLSAEAAEAVLATEEGMKWAQEFEGEFGMMSLTAGYDYPAGALYLEITGVTTNANLVLHGSTSEYVYSLLSVEALTNSNWHSEQVVRGASGQDWTDAAVPVGVRTNQLFFRAKQWDSNDTLGGGISVALTNPANGAYYPEWPTNITLRASATSTNGTILGVAFYAGESLLGLVTDAPYELTWSNVLRGSYELRARAFDSAGAVRSSEPVDISVDPCYPAVDVVLVIDRSGSMGDPITRN